MEGTQVTDLEKKIDYPTFKKGKKMIIEPVEIQETDSIIIENISDNIEGNIKYGLAKLIEDEGEAIAGYHEFLSLNEIDDEVKSQLEEIISDEKNHIEVLQGLLKKYDNIEIKKD